MRPPAPRIVVRFGSAWNGARGSLGCHAGMKTRAGGTSAQPSKKRSIALGAPSLIEAIPDKTQVPMPMYYHFFVNTGTYSA